MLFKSRISATREDDCDREDTADVVEKGCVLLNGDGDRREGYDKIITYV